MFYFICTVKKGHSMHMLKTNELFDLDHTLASPLLSKCEYPWTALGGLRKFITELGNTLPQDEYYSPSDGIWVANSATLAKSAVIYAPCIVGKHSELREGAFIRGAVIIGERCVVGNSCELKNCILLDGAKAPHFNYVGDSILGYLAHMGAGAVTSNVKNDKSEVRIAHDEKYINTGLSKLGAMIGDRAEIGCGCVLNPGAVIGRDASIYPLSCVRGCVPPNFIYKSKDNITPRRKTVERS